MSPHYSAMRDGNMTTIPSDYLSADYKTPPFNVNVKRDNVEKLIQLKNQIDELKYKLHNLSPEETWIIENSVKTP